MKKFDVHKWNQKRRLLKEQFDSERRRDREAPRKPMEPRKSRDPRDLEDPRKTTKPTRDREFPIDPDTSTPSVDCGLVTGHICHQYKECINNTLGPTQVIANSGGSNPNDFWVSLGSPSPGQVKLDNLGRKWKYINDQGGALTVTPYGSFPYISSATNSCCGQSGCPDQAASNGSAANVCGCSGNSPSSTYCCVYDECWDVTYVPCDPHQIPGQQFTQEECISTIGGNPPDLSTNNTFRTGTGVPTTVMINTQQFTNQSGYIDYKIIDINPQSNPVAGTDHDIGMC